jgi:hypothetical protein
VKRWFVLRATWQSADMNNQAFDFFKSDATVHAHAQAYAMGFAMTLRDLFFL